MIFHVEKMLVEVYLLCDVYLGLLLKCGERCESMETVSMRII